MARLIRIASWTVRIGALTWLVAHFALTLLFCFPLNPVKMEAEPLLNRTIGTYFSQNWSLFAPNPIQTNQTLLVQCLSNADTEAVKSPDGLASDRWRDITMPLFQRHQQNRFTAYDRLSRPQTNFLRAFMNGGAGLQPLSKACREGNKDACITGNARLAEIRARAAVPLVKVASSYCRESGEDAGLTHVALRVHDVPVVPWSRRNSDVPPKPVDFEIGVFPIDNDVATTGVLKGAM